MIPSSRRRPDSTLAITLRPFFVSAELLSNLIESVMGLFQLRMLTLHELEQTGGQIALKRPKIPTQPGPFTPLAKKEHRGVSGS